MTHRELCESSKAHVLDLIRRHAAATAGLTEEQLNVRPAGWHWSIAEITEHVHLANGYYLPPMESTMKRGAPGSGGVEAKQTLFGKLIEFGAGPWKSAPAPKQLFPKTGPYTSGSLSSFEADHNRLIAILDAGSDFELSHLKYKNPFMKLFSMSLVDGIHISTAHGERHVGQIEEISQQLRA